MTNEGADETTSDRAADPTADWAADDAARSAAEESVESDGTDDTATVDDVVEVTAVEESDGTDDTATTGGGTRRWILVGAAAALLGGLLTGTGLLGWQVFTQHQINQAREQAQSAAISYAQVLTSIDSDKVDENFQQVLDGATGEFKDMYSQSSVELRQLLIENKATARGIVVDSAVQSATKNTAVVLLFVDQSVSNAKLPDPRIDRSRMKMTLEKVDGRWRASKVELP